MSELLEKFSEKLRTMRKMKKISQDKLANLTDIDRSYVGRIDRGEVNITLDKLYAIAKALECQPADLLPEIDYSQEE
ncbi:helix-turn-helix transcriptional regulator [Shewanella sp. 5_MG-2023]|uniref:helix-turn-helix domain-containing protein n=1 Tax=unclassified Shewanella TaxID=196818 RepID=UPI000C85B67A|nr:MULTISPECIES: helix-turn-helix transcriptional regulator [unclassified Shewanella]MDO6642077.1 helix-turn-helix transcriptional regulator [Shewanella sp. 5_MG-2023]PMH99869.1 transcriptional regulator [Shewanella sp. 10N.286.48.A6]